MGLLLYINMINFNDMSKDSKPVKFRFVITDDEDNVIEVLYETNKEYNSPEDPEWEDECYSKILEISKIYDLTDRENCPNIEIQINCNGFWELHESVIEYWASF